MENEVYTLSVIYRNSKSVNKETSKEKWSSKGFFAEHPEFYTIRNPMAYGNGHVLSTLNYTDVTPNQYHMYLRLKKKSYWPSAKYLQEDGEQVNGVKQHQTYSNLLRSELNQIPVTICYQHQNLDKIGCYTIKVPLIYTWKLSIYIQDVKTPSTTNMVR